MNNGLAFALVSLSIILPATVMGQSQDASAPEVAPPTGITGSAQRVYLDPETGRLLSKPPPGVPVLSLSQAELNMLSSSDAGLVERQLPDGAYLLDLQGRFRHLAVATVADDGTVVIHEAAGGAFLPADSEVSDRNDQDEQ